MEILVQLRDKSNFCQTAGIESRYHLCVVGFDCHNMLCFGDFAYRLISMSTEFVKICQKTERAMRVSTARSARSHFLRNTKGVW
jgi:hypothetical protein